MGDARGSAGIPFGTPPMRMVILDPNARKALIRERRRNGADRFDEVWDGVYVMSPEADNEHQYVALRLSVALVQALSGDRPTKVYPAVNISDRDADWKKNYRCPDAAIFLEGNTAQDRGTHWFGGPDFAVEVVSRYDRSRRKGPFYASVGVRELFLIDRFPWRLELYRSDGQTMVPAGESLPDTAHPAPLASTVLPLRFRLMPETPRPVVEVVHTGTGQTWLV
jgi:Uma2 family endonuclease